MRTKYTKPLRSVQKTSGFGRELKRNWMLYAMALPAIIVLIVFAYIPIAGNIMAFQDLDYSKGIFSSPFVGLKNFEFLFASTSTWKITRNTVLYNLCFIFLNTVLSMGLALLINELRSKTFAKITQTIMIMPYFLSMVVISMIVSAFLDYSNGMLNSVLELFGKKGQNWYNKAEAWPYILVFVNAWKSVGFASVTYTAVISGIPQEYYEASALDGATRWQQIRHITLPHLRTILCINLINSMAGLIRADFGLFYTVTQDSGALYDVTQVLDTYIYNAMKTMSNLGMTTAAGVYQSFVGFIMVLLANKVVKKIDSDSAMF